MASSDNLSPDLFDKIKGFRIEQALLRNPISENTDDNQGRLFDVDTVTPRKRLVKRSHDATESMHGIISGSKLPNDLISLLSGRTTVKPLSGRNGEYYPDDGTININEEDDESTLLHEMGHRADNRLMALERPDHYERNNPNSTGAAFPNPREEGIAEGFADRYLRNGAHRGSSLYTSGPSAGWELNWSPADRAVFAASKEHFANTGEVMHAYNTDEYLHMMRNRSPHAIKAWKKAGLEEEANMSADRYLMKRKVGTQLSLFGPSDEYDIYDIPESHRKLS